MDTEDFATDRRTSPSTVRTSQPRRAPRTPGWRTASRIGLSAAAVTLLAVSTAACQGNGASGSNSAASASESGSQSSSTPSSSTSSGPSASSSASTPSGAGSASASQSGGGSEIGGQSAANHCTSDQLGIKLGPADAGAGNLHYRLTFTNNGSKSCSLHGFPGVSLLQGDGQTIGKPATREGSGIKIVQLAPGKSANATVHTLNRGVKDGGCWKKPALLKAYPPGSKDAMTLRTSSPQVCGDTFTISSMQ